MANVDSSDIIAINPNPSDLNRRTIKKSIELPLLFSVLAISLTGGAINNILLYRSCVHSLHYSKEECRPFLSPIRLNDTADLEKDVQGYTTLVLTVKTVLEFIGPAILSMFLGPWSDTYGRKPLLTSTLFGMVVTGMLIVVYGVVDSLGPWWYILTVLPFSFSGGYVVMLTAAYCYVSDTSSVESTSLRMTMVDATMSLGSVMGSLVCTHLILSFGNVYLLLLAAALNVLSYSYTHIVIEESVVGALRGGATKILDFSLVKGMMRECTKVRPNHLRAQILLIIIVKIIILISYNGTDLLEYLYSREKLNWGLREYNVYSAVGTSISFVGGFLGVMLVQKLLRLSDISFSMLTLLTAIWEYVLKMNVKTSWIMYMSTVVAMFKGLIGPLTRSHLAKSLPVSDVAKVFAFMCAVEGLSAILSPVIFNSLYSATLSTFPGAIYLLSSVLAGICVLLLGIVHYFNQNATYHYLVNE